MRVSLAPVLSGLIVLAFVLAGGIARAETINCTPITTLPVTITSPGVYCLTVDLDGTGITFGNGITIDADNVILDLKGHVLKGPTSTTPILSGIFMNSNHRNVTIRNGTVLGFSQPIFETGRGNVIEDMRLDNGYEVVADGVGTLIRRNTILNSRHGGIGVGGSNSYVVDNDVAGCVGCLGFGIGVSGDHHFVVNNRITGDTAWGILVTSGSGNKIRDNIVSGSLTPYSGGVDVGNNN